MPLIWRIIAGKDLQRDDLVASVDPLVGRRVLAGAELPELREQFSFCFLRLSGLLRGACHRARIRGTCWLAMTEKGIRGCQSKGSSISSGGQMMVGQPRDPLLPTSPAQVLIR